jgi:glutaredoxin
MGCCIDITLYGRPDCCLCDEAKAVLRRVAPAYAAAVREVNIASDRELQARFGEEIPVVFVDGRKAFKFRVPERELRSRLDRALAERRARPQETAR